MNKFRFKIMFFIFIIIIFSGILKVNIEYYRSSGKEVQETIYNTNIDTALSTSKVDTYSEFNLSRKRGTKLRILYKRDPFDLRFDIGNYVMYINKDVYNNMVVEKDKIMNSIKDIINSGIINIKNIGARINDTVRSMVSKGSE